MGRSQRQHSNRRHSSLLHKLKLNMPMLRNNQQHIPMPRSSRPHSNQQHSNLLHNTRSPCMQKLRGKLHNTELRPEPPPQQQPIRLQPSAFL